MNWQTIFRIKTLKKQLQDCDQVLELFFGFTLDKGE